MEVARTTPFCPVCHTTNPALFHKNRTTASGFQTECYPCQKARKQEKRFSGDPMGLIEHNLADMLKNRLVEPEHKDTAKLLLCALNFGSADLDKLAAVSGLSLDEFVRPRAERLRASGVWSEDGKVCFETANGPPENMNIEFILHVLCAEGEVICHRDQPKDEDGARFDTLFEWRSKMLPAPLTPEILAESMTVEALAHEATPEEFMATVTAFRHLRQDARVAAARRWLSRQSP